MSTFARDYARHLPCDERLARADDAAERIAEYRVRLSTVIVLLVLAVLGAAEVAFHEAEERLLDQFARVQVETMEDGR